MRFAATPIALAVSSLLMASASAQTQPAPAPADKKDEASEPQRIEIKGIRASLQQSLLQKGRDADYANQMAQRNLPLQAQESAFGIIPSTGSGSVTHSSGKSGNVGI